MPNDMLLTWANVLIYDHVAVYGNVDVSQPVLIAGNLPGKDYLEAMILMLEFHNIPYINNINDEAITNMNQLNAQKLQKRLGEHPEILKIPQRIFNK